MKVRIEKEHLHVIYISKDIVEGLSNGIMNQISEENKCTVEVTRTSERNGIC